MSPVKIVFLVLLSFVAGCYVGTRLFPAVPVNTSSTYEECGSKCVNIVRGALILWPSLETGMRLLRIIPETRLACERICIAKEIKNL